METTREEREEWLGMFIAMGEDDNVRLIRDANLAEELLEALEFVEVCLCEYDEYEGATYGKDGEMIYLAPMVRKRIAKARGTKA